MLLRLLLGLLLWRYAPWVEWNMDLRWSIRIYDENVNFFKVLEESVKVLEVETAASVISTKLAFSVKDVESIY
jgi:hypothetical protein